MHIRPMQTALLAAAFSLLGLAPGLSPAAAAEKPRVLVLTDIGNEPDDAQSLTRFLLYTNEFDVEGIAATTSTWLRDKINPEMIRKRIRAYGKVRENLAVHADGYPEAEQLLSLVREGQPEFGMAGVGEGKDTEASEWIIETVDKPDPRPLWITVWGGAVDLAQALWKVKNTRPEEEVEEFVRKIRVYTISDQDDTGPWMRRTFPDLFYIVSIHGWTDYRLSTWCGIAGDKWYNFRGPDFSLVSNDWLDRNVREEHGPMGELYPWTDYIMEGDTPSFLYLIPNGLGVPERPDWGSWGGRYEQTEVGRGPGGHWGDTVDTVRGVDGLLYSNNQATVWRWREAYQNDFAARMDWTVAKSFEEANHNPVVTLNGEPGKEPVEISVRSGEEVRLKAGVEDPDGDSVSYEWFQYKEAGTHRGTVDLRNPHVRAVRFEAPHVDEPRTVHFIVSVKDNGEPPLYAYRRAIVNVQPEESAGDR